MRSTPLILIIILFLTACTGSPGNKKVEADSSQTPWPDTSYWNKPEVRYVDTNDLIKHEHMQAFYDVPGEFGHIAEGKDYGFSDLSFIITHTQPGGGPPLHTHTTEEAHVLEKGSVKYIMGQRVFDAVGPYIFRIPPGVPHTFLNTGTAPFRLVAVFPGKTLSYTELGRNPLVKDSTVYFKNDRRPR